MTVEIWLNKAIYFRNYQIPLKNRLILRNKSINGSESGSSTKGQSIKSIFLAIYSRWLFVFLMIFSLSTSLPVTANAGFASAGVAMFDFIMGNSQKNDEQVIPANGTNSQNLTLLTNATNFDSSSAVGGGDITITDDNEALVSESGPSGTLADIDDSVSTGQISTYTVRKGDNLASIAKMYGVTTNTIVWANNITSSGIKEGQVLVILPVSGTLHTVVKGDTLQTIAKKYKADAGEISQFNDINSESILAIGDTIVIPDGEGSVKVSGSAKKSVGKNPLKSGYSGPEYSGYYVRPISSVGTHLSQRLHGYNSVDISTEGRTNLPLFAAASGQVIIARNSGYNGGYGKYVVISHNNGTQTVYGHMNQVIVKEGETVYQGQVIGLSGNTGRSTGPHLHFEVRGAKNYLNQ